MKQKICKCGNIFNYTLNDIDRITTGNITQCKKCMSKKYLEYLKKLTINTI